MAAYSDQCLADHGENCLPDCKTLQFATSSTFLIRMHESDEYDKKEVLKRIIEFHAGNEYFDNPNVRLKIC